MALQRAGEVGGKSTLQEIELWGIGLRSHTATEYSIGDIPYRSVTEEQIDWIKKVMVELLIDW